MRLASRSVAIVAIAVLPTWVAAAGTRKVIVLPLDGNAPAAERARLGAELVKLARANAGEVSVGDTTFAETAAGVGCDPAVRGCADTVLATLGVDEILYGTATTATGTTTVEITRIEKGRRPDAHTLVVVPTETADKLDSQLGPIFGAPMPSEVGSGSSAPVTTGSDTTATAHVSFFDTKDRKLGLGLVLGGGITIAIGLALWASESSLQSQINTAPTTTPKDLANLVSKEDKASSYAWAGNVLVAVGLVASGAGTYFFWRDHRSRTTATVAPAEHGTGMTLVVGGLW